MQDQRSTLITSQLQSVCLIARHVDMAKMIQLFPFLEGFVVLGYLITTMIIGRYMQQPRDRFFANWELCSFQYSFLASSDCPSLDRSFLSDLPSFSLSPSLLRSPRSSPSCSILSAAAAGLPPRPCLLVAVSLPFLCLSASRAFQGPSKPYSVLGGLAELRTFGLAEKKIDSTLSSPVCAAAACSTTESERCT